MSATEPTIAQLTGTGGAEGGPPFVDPPTPPQGFDWRRLLRAQSGPGELDAYDDHPLNPDPGTREGQRIARGIEGITGGARLAIVDLALGLVGYLRRFAARGRPGG